MFKKYNEIENYYYNKHINRFLDMYPELKDTKYIVEHKYDGSNISICIDEENNVRWAKRSQLIAEDDNFMGLMEVKEDYTSFIDAVIEWKNRNVDTCCSVQVYGEIFGTGIQKRCNYGDGKFIRFFDIRIGDEFVSPKRFREIMEEIGYSDLIVETFDMIEGLNNVLEFNPYIKNEFGSLIEGVVIKPYYENYFSSLGSRFILKKKNEEFGEKKQKKQKKKKEADPEVEKLKELFLPYINRNRVLSVFSKEGEIENQDQIGEYIKLVMKDAQEDFYKENDISEIDRNKISTVFKEANREIVGILKEFL